MVVGDCTENIAEVEPNITEETFVNPVPVIMTEFPPAVDPELGDTPATVGALPVDWYV
jgi:hypothetical protein